MKTEKKPTHTPGPKRPEDGAFVTSITGKRVPLALVDAAPELLEAAKEAAYLLNVLKVVLGKSAGARHVQIGRWLNLLTAAIAKAEAR